MAELWGALLINIAIYKAVLPLVIKLISVVTFYELSFSEIKDILYIGLQYYAFTELNYALGLAGLIIQCLVSMLNTIISLYTALTPWITKSWATLTAPKATSLTNPDDALTIDVENSIYRLLISDEPSAQQKGELLQALWDKVNADVSEGNLSYAQGLNKAYPVDARNNEGIPQSLSFWQVASTRRDLSVAFKVPSTPSNASLSFFGKPTTASKLKAHVDFNPLAVPLDEGLNEGGALLNVAA